MANFEIYKCNYFPGCRFTFDNEYAVSILEHKHYKGYADVAILRPNGEFLPMSEHDSVRYLPIGDVGKVLSAVASAQSDDEIFCFLDTGLSV